MNVKNDFLVKISFVFQTATKVFFVMDFARGGELYQHWKKAGKFEEERVRFYAVQIISALGYLHS